MIRNTLVLAALAATAVAGPCKPGSSSTELLSTTIGSTETSYFETSITETTSSAAVTETVPSIASSDATTTAEVTTTSGSESTTTSADVCVQSLAAPNGEPRFTDRLADCQEFNIVTVSSYEVTLTAYKRGNVITIPTNAIVRRAEGEAATTILPTGTPAYATYCDSPAAYYEACSELGVTAFTTTIPEPTTIEVITTN
ncbi:hypothetical protein RAB80_011698 [Fusarium oxysporum f. sp. vasinfectum]|uniref:Uncharacterized protein n=1 Tax=Fusarium oxysporum f. sp. vasinfectum 25433 TaxID=1089449 RepID=X0LFT8_FUSOX|nr:hypothetical protein FOTG_12058 [Fusarium oxysporum f. sp. vasinfectum 25433]KAK2671619.1 hypothetical protein RAB80_011698 [Fusarium oxysporum f. sp. vasinfectum]KAK2929086.1 hypothetical protein FoTM2_011950 [Fusarium oxysporum f. sp. vasinfectum]